MQANLGMVIYEMAQPIDIIGPWEVLALWKSILNAPINLCLIAQTEGDVQLDSGITIKAHYSFANAPQLDYLLVPGGRGRMTQVNNEKMLHFIQQQAEKARYVLSICTGMFLLAKAGLLENLSATTYWRALPELKKFKNVNVVEERIVKNGKIWTSGGITSGIDLALAFIEEIAGTEVAGQVQLLLEYFPENKLYCSDKTIESLPGYQGGEKMHERDLPAYIRAHLEDK